MHNPNPVLGPARSTSPFPRARPDLAGPAKPDAGPAHSSLSRARSTRPACPAAQPPLPPGPSSFPPRLGPRHTACSHANAGPTRPHSLSPLRGADGLVPHASSPVRARVAPAEPRSHLPASRSPRLAAPGPHLSALPLPPATAARAARPRPQSPPGLSLGTHAQDRLSRPI